MDRRSFMRGLAVVPLAVVPGLAIAQQATVPVASMLVGQVGTDGVGGFEGIHTYHIDARGAQGVVAQKIVAALRAYDRQLPGRISEMQMTGV